MVLLRKFIFQFGVGTFIFATNNDKHKSKIVTIQPIKSYMEATSLSILTLSIVIIGNKMFNTSGEHISTRIKQNIWYGKVWVTQKDHDCRAEPRQPIKCSRIHHLDLILVLHVGFKSLQLLHARL